MGYRATKSKIKAGNSKAKSFDSINATANIGYTTFFYHTFRNVLIISIPLVIISAIILSSLHISATDSTSSTDTLSFNISSSCTLSSVVDSSHTAELINGTYVSGIGQTTITTLCNDGNGYSVYATGYSNNEEGNNKLVNTESSNFNIVSGTAESGNTSNWAMSLNNLKDDPSLTPPTITSDYDSIYGIVPDRWTKVVSLPARATDMIKGSSFTTTYAVYTSSSQYAGTYNGQVKYMLVHPNNNKPTLTNLEVAFASHGIQPAYQDETGSYFAMQDMTTKICNSVSGDGEATATQLVDIRDNKLYWVTKLRDGHCWMTQNLDFNLGIKDAALDVDTTILTSNDTDLNDSSMSGAYSKNYNYDTTYNVISWSPQNITKNYTTGTGTNWTSNPNVAYSLDPNEWYWDGDDSTPNCNFLDPSKGCAHFTQNKTDANKHLSIGNYYNWSAAIASDDSSSLNTSTYSDISLNPQNSICPKGWRLPTISNMAYTATNSTSEFGRLNQLYNSSGSADFRLISTPLWFVRAGRIQDSLTDPGSYAGYWSSTVANNAVAYYLSFGTTNIKPADTFYNRGRGWSIRCVAR